MIYRATPPSAYYGIEEGSWVTVRKETDVRGGEFRFSYKVLAIAGSGWSGQVRAEANGTLVSNLVRLISRSGSMAGATFQPLPLPPSGECRSNDIFTDWALEM